MLSRSFDTKNILLALPLWIFLLQASSAIQHPPKQGVRPVRPPYYYSFRPPSILTPTELQLDIFYLAWDMQYYNYAKRLQKRGAYRWSYYWLPRDYYEPDDIELERLLR
jgi:hypothetical protein